MQSQKHAGIVFNSAEDKGLFIFVDTGLETDTFTGIVAIHGGAVIKMSCLRQKFASLSTYSAELAGMSEGIKMALELQAKLKDAGDLVGTVTVFGDNKAAVQELQEGAPEKVAPKARHHRLRLFWAKQVIQAGLIECQWISTTKMLADVATKPLGKELWNQLVPQIMGTAPIEALEGLPTVTEMYGPSHATAAGGKRKTTQ